MFSFEAATQIGIIKTYKAISVSRGGPVLQQSHSYASLRYSNKTVSYCYKPFWYLLN